MSVVEDTQQVRAQAKWVRTSPRKARLVVEHIRGRSVPEARTVLAFTPRAAAREVENVLRSAVANAEANHGLVGDQLYVHAAVVDEGPTLKRWRARARGRVARIRRRTCHITLLLAPIPEAAREEKPAPAPARRRRKAAAAAEPAQTADQGAQAEKPTEDKPTEEKPKRRRAPRRKGAEG
jgi:ribosomal protein L22